MQSLTNLPSIPTQHTMLTLPNPMPTNKEEARKILQSQRKIANQSQPNAPQQIIKSLTNHKFYKHLPPLNTCYVAGYLPIASEINPMPLLAQLRQQGATLLMPAIVKPDSPLEFREWHENTKLINESFGTKAPPKTSPKHIPDIIIAPLLGFNSNAYRLGYGGGFYDRSIQDISKTKKIITMGIAYEQQKLDNLPHDEHDMQLHAVITPCNVYTGNPIS